MDSVQEQYTIWLQPEESASQKLKDKIADYANQASSKIFLPHVTLLGNITESEQAVIEKVRTLALGIQSISIFFNGIATSDLYFQSLYLKCKKTPELMDLNARAQKLFSKSNKYNPHLSLLYSDLSMPKKDLILAKDRDLDLKAFAFDVRTLSLWYAKGTIDNWRKVFEVPFKL